MIIEKVELPVILAGPVVEPPEGDDAPVSFLIDEHTDDSKLGEDLPVSFPIDEHTDDSKG